MSLLNSTSNLIIFHPKIQKMYLIEILSEVFNLKKHFKNYVNKEIQELL